MLYSQIPINENSHKDQVNIVTPVTGRGDPYVDDFPIAPKKKIHLVEEDGPGSSPVDITVALNLANNGTNFLDIVVRFYVSTKPTGPGTQVGSEYRGFQFFSNDGLVTPIKFPLYQNSPVTVGSEGVSYHRDRAPRHRQQPHERVRQRQGQQRRLVRRLRTRRLPLRGQRHGIRTDHLSAAQRGRLRRPDVDRAPPQQLHHRGQPHLPRPPHRPRWPDLRRLLRRLLGPHPQAVRHRQLELQPAERRPDHLQGRPRRLPRGGRPHPQMVHVPIYPGDRLAIYTQDGGRVCIQMVVTELAESEHVSLALRTPPEPQWRRFRLIRSGSGGFNHLPLVNNYSPPFTWSPGLSMLVTDTLGDGPIPARDLCMYPTFQGCYVSVRYAGINADAQLHIVDGHLRDSAALQTDIKPMRWSKVFFVSHDDLLGLWSPAPVVDTVVCDIELVRVQPGDRLRGRYANDL
ncbi:MAG: hypothetical protein IPK80_01605 [Nannocystis sp.]|nr:hypothetical protein [Nannocystis sp.]